MQTIRIRGARTHNLRNIDLDAAARAADRDHRAVRLGQVVAGIRHALRRRAAPLRRVAVGLCASVPRDDGQARCRQHRGPVAGDRHRAEDRLAQPALDRRHRDRDLRLPAAAVRACRHAALSASRHRSGGADRQPDGRPGARRPERRARAADSHRWSTERRGEHTQLLAELAGQGFVRVRIDGTVHEIDAVPQLDPKRKHTHRGGGRSLPRAPGGRAAAGRVIRDRAARWAAAWRGSSSRTIPRSHRCCSPAATPVPVCGFSVPPLEPRMFSFNNPGRRLPDLRRAGLAGILRSRARRRAPAPVARRRRGARLGSAQRALLPDAAVAGASLRIRHRDALDRAARARASRCCCTGSGEEEIEFSYQEGRGRHRAARAMPSRASYPIWSAAFARPIRRRCARSCASTWARVPARPAAARA